MTVHLFEGFEKEFGCANERLVRRPYNFINANRRLSESLRVGGRLSRFRTAVQIVGASMPASLLDKSHYIIVSVLDKLQLKRRYVLASSAVTECAWLREGLTTRPARWACIRPRQVQVCRMPASRFQEGETTIACHGLTT